jgi:phage shock protein PspC (stress-responsive transcriptional regulator)
MQEEPAGFERSPGDQHPPAGDPPPPPPQPEAAHQPPPPPQGGQPEGPENAGVHQPPPPQGGPGGPGYPGGPAGPGYSGGPGGPGYPGGPAGPGQPTGPGYPGGGYQGGHQPYPPGGGYAAPRRLTRRTDDRVIAGVSSGLGAYFGVDPVIFRIGFVALTLAGGTGILIYLLLWAVLPGVHGGGPGVPPPGGGGTADPPIVAALRQGGGKRMLAIAAVLVALLLLVGPFAHGSVVFALVLIGVGVLLMVHEPPSHASGVPGGGGPGRPTPPTGGGWYTGEPRQPWEGSPQPDQSQGGQPPSGDTARMAYAGAATTQPVRDDTRAGWAPAAGWGGGQGAWQPPAGHPAAQRAGGPAGTWGAAGTPGGWGSQATTVERKPKPRSVLGWLTVAAALLATGVATALDNLGVVTLTPARAFALVLTVIGAGLLIGSVWGRAWWLILLGLLLVPMMAATTVASDVPVRGRTGEQFERPTTVAAVQPVYEMSGGHLNLNLTDVPFDRQPRAVTVRMGAGDLDVIVPKDLPVTVHYNVGAGEAQVLGRPGDGGFKASKTVTEDGSSKLGRLDLDLHLGVGQIVVTRESS